MADQKQPRKKMALGRGLSALLDDSAVKKSGSSDRPKRTTSHTESLSEVEISQIEVNPFQPRTEFDKEALEELSASIKLHGIIQPMTLRKVADKKYQLISGERRLQASKLAGLKKVPAYVRTANDQQMLEMALIENIQREDLNALEIAFSYQRLRDECKLTQEELGDRVGKKRSTVNNYLRLLRLPPDIQAAVRDKRISMGHARALVNIENVDAQIDIYQSIIKEDLSVRAVEKIVRDYALGKYKQKKKSITESSGPSAEIKNLTGQLSSHFGTKVDIKADGKNKGEIKIPFVSTDDLNRILEILGVI